MSAAKKIKVDLNDEEILKCMNLIDNGNSEVLCTTINLEMANKALFPDSTESGKTRLIFYAIKANKLDYVKLFLNAGLNVNEEYSDNELDKEDFSSLSPIHYCIEKKCSLDMLKLLLDHNRRLTKSLIMSTILANNAPALKTLIFHGTKSFVQRELVQLTEIIECFVSHPEIEITEVLQVLRERSMTMVKMQILAIDDLPSLNYLATKRTECLLEEAIKFVQLCKFLDSNINALESNTVPLHTAMRFHNRNFVKALVKEGANIRRHNCDGRTILYEAYQRKDEDLFKFLLDNGADSQQNNFGFVDQGLGTEGSTIHVYSLHGRLITNESNVLHSVLTKRDILKILQIIKLDKNLNISGDNGNIRYPILFYIMGYYVATLNTKIWTEYLMTIVTTCLNMGFNINTRCQRNQLINEIHFKGHTLLHLAVRFFSTDLCYELIKKGADPTLLTEYNQCTYSLTLDYLLGLHPSAEVRHNLNEKFQFIQDCNISLTIKLPPPLRFPKSLKIRRFKHFPGDYASTAAQIILNAKKLYIFVLSYHWLCPTTFGILELEMALRTGNFLATKMVLNSMKDKWKCSLLNVSHIKYLFTEPYSSDCFNTFADFRVILRILCDRGFKINSVDNYGNSLFHYAARSSQFPSQQSVEDFFGLMISLGGFESIDSANEMLQTPLHWVISSSNTAPLNCKLCFLYVLLRHGADVRRKTLQGYSAIHIAINARCKTIVQHLIGEGDLDADYDLNSWIRSPCTKSLPKESEEEDEIVFDEVIWPFVAVDKYYEISPVTVAVINGDMGMVELLLKHGAKVDKTDIHNSLYVTNSSEYKMTNYLFQHLPKNVSFESDCLDGNKPTLEHCFGKVHQLASGGKTIDSNSVLNLAINFVSRKYDINVKYSTYSSVMHSIVHIALMGKGQPSGNTQLFSYLMEHSDYNFVEQEKLLSFIVYGIIRLRCLFTDESLCLFDTNTETNSEIRNVNVSRRNVLVQREYFIRLLLQKLPPSKWASCSFNCYVYHKEDNEILNAMLLTGARANLIREWPNIKKFCVIEEDPVKAVDNFIAVEEFEKKIESSKKNPPTLVEMSLMAITEFSPDVREVLTSMEFPKRMKELIAFLDVETDENLFMEMLSLSESL